MTNREETETIYNLTTINMILSVLSMIHEIAISQAIQE